MKVGMINEGFPEMETPERVLKKIVSKNKGKGRKTILGRRRNLLKIVEL